MAPSVVREPGARDEEGTMDSPRSLLDEMIGENAAMGAVRATLARVLRQPAASRRLPPILLQGETGTGKGLLAQALYRASPRAAGPFVEVNCAAIPETLLEAELFGYERGAFTGAQQAKPGLFQAAHRGTLFLDEVGLLPVGLQGKLLKAIEERVVRRLGSTRSEPVDVWILTATSADLRDAMRERQFQEALYHRLAVVPVWLPPLRERGQDIVLLAAHCLARACADYGLPPKTLTPEAHAALLTYPWPGNVRELSNTMERVALLADAPQITAPLLGLPEVPSVDSPAPEPAHTSIPLAAAVGSVEREQLLRALQQTGWNISHAATLLGISRNTLRYRIERHGLRPASAPLSPGQQHAPPAPTAPAAPLETPAVVGPPAVAWEQKPVAVLALALTFPTAGSEAPGYEPWTVAARWEQGIVEKVEGFGGFFLPRAPALLTAVFGVPRALEQLPQRAVHAALAIRQLAAEGRSTGGGAPGPVVRLAVHVGTVLVDVHAEDPLEHVLALGETLTLPVRLLGHAAAGDILVSPQVERRVGGWFALQARALPLGAGEEPVEAYQVMGVGPRHGRWAGGGGRTLSRFVGRERELAALHDLWQQVQGGRGRW